MYLWQNPSWANFTYDEKKIQNINCEIFNNLGILEGKMSVFGFDSRSENTILGFTSEIQKSFEIEGVKVSDYALRSSIARKLGLEKIILQNGEELDKIRPHIDSIVEVVTDAVLNCDTPLTFERLFDWHKKLFGATGENAFNGLYSIKAGKFRTDEEGPMRVVSGFGKNEIVHFQAMPAEKLQSEMQKFLDWLNKKTENSECIIKSAVAHLYFIEIHPFEDGNGRLARAIADMVLFRGLKTKDHLFSMSSELCKQRKTYYSMIQNTEKSTSLGITEWILWYAECMNNAIKNVLKELDDGQKRKEFWQKIDSLKINDRQRKLLQMLLSDFEGKLTSSKYAKICKCSQDTASRDLNFLVLNKILISKNGGRSTEYLLFEY